MRAQALSGMKTADVSRVVSHDDEIIPAFDDVGGCGVAEQLR
jgi:hypothetical protein